MITMGMESFGNFNQENTEKPTWHYVYTDGKVLGNPVIFECDADDDLAAQEKFTLFIQENHVDISDSEIHRSIIKN